MVPVPAAGRWQQEFERWLEPFLEALGHKARRRWAPLYLRGLIEPGRRKSVEPLAARVAPGQTQQLHHFVSTSPWKAEPLEEVLVRKANALVGGPDAHLIVDDTALVKKGRHSVGVARQYCGELGKKANCQALVSLTLARREVPVCVGLRLFLPASWAEDGERRRACGVPEEIAHQPKWEIALEEIDRVRAAGAEFGDVLADAGYGMAAEFRRGLSERRLLWAVGILPTQKVYPENVRLRRLRPRARGRPCKHPAPSAPSRSAQAVIDALGPGAFRRLTWRRGTKGPLRARFVAVRVRVADGPLMSKAQHLPGELAWLVCEWRDGGEKKYHLSNYPAQATLAELARAIRGRWVCEQPHQQMKQELGLDHYEGRSWLGLRHHCLLSMIAYAFLQHLRLGGKKGARPTGRRPLRASRKCADSS
jgi:SRSO17 transposase